MRSVFENVPFPLVTQRRPERFVPDIAASAGAMDSIYVEMDGFEGWNV
jgi:hypothetical protein